LRAIAASRRWRRATSKLLNNMTAEEQIVFLNRHLNSLRAPAASKPPRELAHR